MSIERIKEEAAKADQRIMEFAKQGQPVEVAEVDADEVPDEAAQPEVVEQSDQGVAVDAATEDQEGHDSDSQAREQAALWEQRYRSLDGMIKARDRQIEQLHQLLAGMQQAAPAKEAEPQKEKKVLVSKADEDAFGSDLVDLARRVAREESGEYVAALEAKLADLTARLGSVSQETALSAQTRFENSLSAAVPNWKTIDADPKYIAWLQDSATRLKLFTEAARSMNVGDVAYFYKEYGDRSGASAAPKVDARLEKQIAPGKGKAVATAAKAPSEKKQWTRSEIARVYAERKRYTPEDFGKLERDIASAQREGRVDYAR